MAINQNEITQVIKNLTKYKTKRASEAEYLTFAGKILDYSRAKKLAAVDAFIAVLEGRLPSKTLEPHLRYLNQGRLKKIFTKIPTDLFVNNKLYTGGPVKVVSRTTTNPIPLISEKNTSNQTLTSTAALNVQEQEPQKAPSKGAADNRYEIFLRSLTGNTKTISIDKKAPMTDFFKMARGHIIGDFTPPRLICAGRQLDDNNTQKTVEETLANHSTVHEVFGLRGD